MRIMHIISSPSAGGAEVYVKDLVIELKKSGHFIIVVFLNHSDDIGRSNEYEKIFLSELSDFDIPYYFLGFEVRKKPWLGFLRLRRLARQSDIQICHSHLAFGILFSAILNIPVVYTHHSIRQRWNKLTYTVFNKIVDEYVGISKICADALEVYTGRNVVIINNAVSPKKFEGYTRQRKLEDTVRIAMVGRIALEKDYMNALRAINNLDYKLLSKIKLYIAGEEYDEIKKTLNNFVDLHNLNNVVTFVGNINNIPKFLYEADVFMMSSSTEGLPIALTEAIVSGLPCIVTDVGGCAEVIANSQNGFVVPANDPQALALHIEKLINQEDLIEVFSKNALTNSYKYSISIAAQSHVQLYNSIV